MLSILFHVDNVSKIRNVKIRHERQTSSITIHCRRRSRSCRNRIITDLFLITNSKARRVLGPRMEGGVNCKCFIRLICELLMNNHSRYGSINPAYHNVSFMIICGLVRTKLFCLLSRHVFLGLLTCIPRNEATVHR